MEQETKGIESWNVSMLLGSTPFLYFTASCTNLPHSESFPFLLPTESMKLSYYLLTTEYIIYIVVSHIRKIIPGCPNSDFTTSGSIIMLSF